MNTGNTTRAGGPFDPRGLSRASGLIELCSRKEGAKSRGLSFCDWMAVVSVRPAAQQFTT